jgi:hypothetical protein
MSTHHQPFGPDAVSVVGRAPTRRAGAHLAPVCACGQDLDVGGGHYCPRCGVALRRHHAGA